MSELIRRLIVTFRNPRAGFQLTVVRQFVKFCMVGVINTVVSFSVYTVLTRYASLDPLVANGIAFVIAVTTSFTFNKQWTFNDRGAVRLTQYYRFFSISVVGLLLSESIMFILHKLFLVHDMVAFASAVVVVMFWNFSANRAWTFGKR